MNAEANFTGLVFHCFLQSSQAMGSDTACLRILAGSHVIFLQSTFIFHPPASNSSRGPAPQEKTEGPLTYQSLVFIYNAVVSFVDCRFKMAAPRGASPVAWSSSQEAEQDAALPVFVRTAYDAKALRSGCRTLYQHDWRRSAPPVFHASRQQQCVDFLSQQQDRKKDGGLHHMARAYHPSGFAVSCEGCHFGLPAGLSAAAILARGPLLLRHSTFAIGDNASQPAGAAQTIREVRVEEMHNWNTGFGAALLFSPAEKVSSPLTGSASDRANDSFGYDARISLQGWSLRDMQWFRNENQGRTPSNHQAGLLLYDCSLQVPHYNDTDEESFPILLGPAWLQNTTLVAAAPRKQNRSVEEEEVSLIGYFTGLQITSLTLTHSWKAGSTLHHDGMPGAVEGDNGAAGTVVTLEGVVASEALSSTMASTLSAMEDLVRGMTYDRLRLPPVVWPMRCGMLLLPLPAPAVGASQNASKNSTWRVVSMTWSIPQAALLVLLDEDTSFRLVSATLQAVDTPGLGPVLHNNIVKKINRQGLHSALSQIESLAPLTLIAFQGPSASMQDVLFRNITSGTPAAMVLSVSPQEAVPEPAPGGSESGLEDGSDGVNTSIFNVTFTRTVFRDNVDSGLLIRQESSSSLLHCRVKDSMFHRNSAAASGGGLLLQVKHPQVQKDMHSHATLAVAIENSTLVQNSAVQNGGGMACEVVGVPPDNAGATGLPPLLRVSLSTVFLEGNVAEQEGGALYAAGVGVDVVITNATLEDNVATVKGGAIAATQGASLTMMQGYCRSNQVLSTEGGCLVAYGAEVQVALYSTALSSNAAPTGGGIATTEGATLHLMGSVMSAGRGHFGAGVLLRGSTATLHGAVLSNNTASGCGAALAALAAQVSAVGIEVRWNAASDCGGGVYLYASTAAFKNGSRIGPGNVVGGGGEDGGDSGDGSAVTLINRGSLLHVDDSSTVSGNGRDAWMHAAAAAALRCSSHGSLVLEAAAAWWGHNRPYDLYAEPSCTASMRSGAELGKAGEVGMNGASFVASDALLTLLRQAVQVAGDAPLMAPAGDVRLLHLPQPSLAAACVPTCLRLYVGQQEVSHSMALRLQGDGSKALAYAVPAGSGTDMPVTLFLQGQTPAQEPWEVLHYAPPIVTGVAPSILPRDGGTLTFTGRQFGVPRFPAADVVVTIGGRACNAPRVWNDTTLSCTALGQTGTSLEVSLIVGGQTGMIQMDDDIGGVPASTSLQLPQVDPPGHVTILTVTPVATALEQAGAGGHDEDTLQRYNVLPDAVDVTLELENGDTGGIPLQSYAVRLRYTGGAYDGHSVIESCTSVSCRLSIQPGYGQHVQLEAAALTEVYSEIHGNAVFGSALSLSLAWPPLPLARDDVRFHALSNGVNMSIPVWPSARVAGSSSTLLVFPDGGSPPIAVAVVAFDNQGTGGSGGSCTVVLLPGYAHCAPVDLEAFWQETSASDLCLPWDDAGFLSRCSQEGLDIVEASMEGCSVSSEGRLRTCTVPLPEALEPGASYSISLAVATAAAWSTWTTPVERGIPCPYGQGFATESPVSSAHQLRDDDGSTHFRDIMHCKPCGPGTYQAMDRLGAEASRCLKCPPGAVQPLFGQADCITCPAGSFADAAQHLCVPCPLGSYGPRPGLQGSCWVCAAGWYASHEGSVACTPCPAAGVLCQNGLLQVLPGYWRPPPSTSTAAPLSNTSQLYRCPDPDACLAVAVAGDRQTVNFTAIAEYGKHGNTSWASDTRGKVLFVHECDVGYKGPVCGVCAHGYAELGGTCTDCWDTSLNIVMLLLCLLVMGGLAVVLIVRSRRPKSLSSMLVRLLLDYLQLTWITGEFAARGPALFREILGFTSLSNGVSLDISFAQCGMSSSYASRFALYMGLPLLVPAAIAVGMVLHRGVRHGIRRLWYRKQCRTRLSVAFQRLCRCCSLSGRTVNEGVGEAVCSKDSLSRKRRPLRLFNPRVFVSASLILLVLLHSRVTREVFAAFRCYSEPLPSVEGGAMQYYLRAQLDEVCYRGWRMALAGTVGVVFVVGLPLGILLTLYRLRAAIRRGDQAIGKALGFLFAGYSIERGLWYWEALVMFRKVWL